LNAAPKTFQQKNSKFFPPFPATKYCKESAKHPLFEYIVLFAG